MQEIGVTGCLLVDKLKVWECFLRNLQLTNKRPFCFWGEGVVLNLNIFQVDLTIQ